MSEPRQTQEMGASGEQRDVPEHVNAKTSSPLAKCARWAFSLAPIETPETNPRHKLLASMRITAACRYNASARLIRLNQYSVFTTIALSLGLILIPLLQSAAINVAFSDKTLNMMQIFLAVFVLVYSVVSASAKFEVRADRLNTCGDRIKDLMRRLRGRISVDSNLLLDQYHQRYSDIAAASENHSRVDFWLAQLERIEMYRITGIARVWLRMKVIFVSCLPYAIPSLMIALELLFISDMLGVTRALPWLKRGGG